MSLYDDAYAEYGNRNGSLTYTYNNVIYSPYDFGGDSYTELYNSCIGENGAGIRSVFLPDSIQTISMTNSAVIGMLRGAYNVIQENQDAYGSILNQIVSGTITETAQIAPAWDAYLSTYSNNRIVQPTNEALASSISAISLPVQANWTEGNTT